MPPTSGGSATGEGKPSVALTWSPSNSPDVTGYNLYYGQIDGFSTNEISAGNITNCLLYGLSPGTYWFEAATVNASGIQSAMSEEIYYTVTGMIDQTWLECNESTDMVHWCWQPLAVLTNSGPQTFYGRLRVRQVAIKVP